MNIGRPREQEGEQPGPAPSLAASRLPFNGADHAASPLRARSVPPDTIKAIKTALGATVNDVVMAVCAARAPHLPRQARRASRRRSIAMVPVSIRTGDE